MRILALIPARGGSKRVPGKNIKALGELPLIAWTIRAALDSGVCLEVRVSTDDPAIAHVARRFGANVANFRPSELSTDTASSVDVAIYELDCFEAESGAVDGLLLLQPTSPFRTAHTIERAVALFGANIKKNPIASFSPASSHPAWCFRVSENGVDPFLGWDSILHRSQDLDAAWMLNGAIYLIAPDRLRNDRMFITSDLQPLLMSNWMEAIDIDTQDDWTLAEAMLSVKGAL